ncbi:MAG: Fe-S cluster assembly protein SufD [Anaerolineales bacterium]
MARKDPNRNLPFTREMTQLDQELPAVLKDYRTASWEAVQETPLPTVKDEDWRRTPLARFDFNTVEVANGKYGQEPPSIPEQAILSGAITSDKPLAVLQASGIRFENTSHLEKQGVIFSSLTDAARDHPELVGKVLGKVVSPQEGVFAAAVGAFSHQGIFLYVPKGVVVEEPIFGLAISPGGKSAHFFQTVIYLEEGAAANYLQETLSLPGSGSSPLAGENLEVIVGPSAKLQITELENYGEDVWSFGHKRAKVERDGRLEWEIGALGAQLSKHFVTIDLIGTGAEGRVSGILFTDGDQHLTYNTMQRHLAPRTTSDLLFKGALTGSSRTVWRGMIYVAEGARFIDGYQANRNLVLDPDARSDSIPGLEILNNDVRCTHGSTVGKIDQEELFYLLSRGITRDQAEQLIIQGFFNDVIVRFSIPEVGELFWDRIKNRLLSRG